MKENRELSGFKEKISAVKKQLDDFMRLSDSVKPGASSLRIIFIYLLLGGAWILFSDMVVEQFTNNPNTITMIQHYKGWVFVAVSGVVFFLIIYKQMHLYKSAIKRIFDGYKELSDSYETQMRMEGKLYTYAYTDSITALPNRFRLQEYLEEQLICSQKEGGKVALILVDIDNFKNVNDMLGHAAGDRLMRDLADILTRSVCPPDMVARVGGDEYAILLTDAQSLRFVEKELSRIHALFNHSMMLDGKDYFVSVSMGVALYPEHGEDAATLMQNADTAMFSVKENGKNGFVCFDPCMREKTIAHVRMSSQMSSAIVNGEFMLCYQPEIDMESGKILSAEALVRWNHPSGRLLPPKDFIPFAERTGRIAEIDDWVFAEVCGQIERWSGITEIGFRVSVNLSGIGLLHDGRIEKMRRSLEKHHITGDRIVLEITETALLTDLEKAMEVLQKLKEMGFMIALDDFGTGYSSLTYLRKLPIDIVKVDRSFIKDLIGGDESRFIFKLIVDLAHHLGLTVVAEGVETKEQLDFLCCDRCDIGQGFYFSKPVIPGEMEALLRERTVLGKASRANGNTI